MAITSVDTPLPALETLAAPPGTREGRVAVLMYHGIERQNAAGTDLAARKYHVPEAQFHAQLAALASFRTVLLSELDRGGETGAAGRARRVVLTFDDGLESVYEIAWPLLQARGARAEVFINPASVGAAGYANWRQLRAMAEAGMAIQSHGWAHLDLTRLPPRLLRESLFRSKAEIEERIGAPVETLAVPFGLCDRRVIALALEAGYRRICNSSADFARPGVSCVPRFAVYRSTSAAEVLRLASLQRTARARRAAREVLVAAPRRLKRARARLAVRHQAHCRATTAASLDAAPVATPMHVPPRSEAAQPLRIFVLIDALGGECPAARDWLADLCPYRASLRTILGFSSGAIPTILTGQPPAATGHWNLFYFDPAGSPFRWLRHLDFVPRRLRNGRLERKALTLAGRHLLGLGPLFECGVEPSLARWFNWVEKNDIFAPGGIWGAPSIFDELAAKGFSYRVYTYRHFTDEQALLAARADVAASDARFYFLYLSELDGFLHFHCQDQRAIAERLAWYGSQLRALYAAARQRSQEVMLTIFSDHGMTPVIRRVDLAGEIGRLSVEAPRDYLAVYDSTMARFWFFSERGRRAILDCLSRQTCGRLLNDAELDRQGVFFPDRRFGQAIFLLSPGCMMARSHFNGAGWDPAGMHGYEPDDPDSRAIFLSDRQPPRAMSSIADIHACLRLGVEEASQ